jgi:acetolactate synthase-1/2/3 large subunit
MAAEAHGRVSGGLGVALVTTGPGGTNALTGVAGAWLSSTPCLILSGQVKRQDLKGDSGLRQRGPQELDIVAMAAPITKYAVTVMEPTRIRYHLEKALHLARSGRQGPVWLDIPLDVQAATVEPEGLEGFAPEPPAEAPGTRLEAAAGALARWLGEAERPVLLLGNGVHLAGAAPEAEALIAHLGLPVLCTWAGSSLLPHDHPLCFGKPGLMASRGANFTLQNADLLVAIGARLDPDLIGFDHGGLARGARKVVVDIDGAELAKLRMEVALALETDARDFIRALLAQDLPSRDRSAWIRRCQGWKDRYPLVLPEHHHLEGGLHPFVFTEALCRASGAGDLVYPCSSGAGIEMFWMAFRAQAGQRAYCTGGLGAMGYGLPAAIGACLAADRARTLCVDGDGGFFMNIQELETVARLALPITFYVFNNGGYASIRTMQRNHFQGRLVACDPSSGLSLPDLERVAGAFGLPFLRISNEGELEEGLARSLASPGPMVVEVLIDPAVTIGPRVQSTVQPDGTMRSRPLEDLSPLLDREELEANMAGTPRGGF